MADRAALDFRGLAIRDLVIAPGASPITQAIAPGEIVGLAGLDGHGQELFLKMLAGLDRRWRLDRTRRTAGASRKITGFRKAVASGIAYLPRDRRATGIFPTQSVLDNFAVVDVVARHAARPDQPRRRARRATTSTANNCRSSRPGPMRRSPRCRAATSRRCCWRARWRCEPAILLLNDPTRGVDVGDAACALRRVSRAGAHDGMALVVLSSEIEEILLLCDRVLVFREHEVAARDLR